MFDRAGPSTWFPDRPPKRSDIVGAICGFGVVLVVLPQTWPLAWGKVGGGFVAIGLALGPVSNTRLADAVGRWFRAIGVGGRIVVICLYACAVGLLVAFEVLPSELFANAAIGGLLGGILYTGTYVLWANRGCSWEDTREDDT